MTINEKYLELGLHALGRSDEIHPGWFGGHFGAALLAAYYMNKEYDLPDHVRIGLKRIADHFIARSPQLFVPYENETPDPTLLNRVIEGLRANAARLSNSGHGLAYGFLALKAFTDRPDLLLPSIVTGFFNTLLDSSQGSGNRYFGLVDYSTYTLEQVTDIPEYRSLDDLGVRALTECSRVIPSATIDGKRYHFTGEVEHGLTHAQALYELARLGYIELTESGMHNHRIQMHLNRRIPEEYLHTEITDPPFETLFAPDYWSQVYNDPHALKVPYAALYLIRKLPADQQPAAERNVCKILCQMN